MTSATTTRTDRAEVEAVVLPELERWHVPGMAIGVLHADGATEMWGFGVVSIDTGQPVRPDTLFQIGSISKVFTATLIMRLVDEGRVDLDTPISRILPSFRLADERATSAVTLRQCLSHQTGFWGDNFKDFGPGDDALAKAIAEFPSLRQITAPGEMWAYCNTAFQAAGAVIEHLCGTTVEQAIRERVLEPLRLRRSYFFAHEAITYPVAIGHNKLPGKDLEIARPYQLQRCMNAAGGIIAPVADLLTFAAFHLGDGTVPVSGDGSASNRTRLLDEASLQEMQRPRVEAGSFADHYGIGWALRAAEGVTLVEHGGSTNGFRARLVLVPERAVAIALLTNGSGGAAANRVVETWALKRLADVTVSEAPVMPLSPGALGRFAGRYEQPLAEIAVAAEGESLRITTVSRNPFNDTRVEMPPFHAVPIGPSRFRITDGEAAGGTIDFIPGPGDTVRFIRLGGRLADRQEANA